MESAGTGKPAGQGGEWRTPTYDHVQMLMDSTLPFKDLDRRGFDQAIASGADAANEADREALTKYAQFVAADTYVPKFDPSENAQDKLRQERHEADSAELHHVQKAAKFALAEVISAEAAYAQVRNAETAPVLTAVTIFFSVAALVLSFAPTLHDRFFVTLGLALVSWSYALSAAAALAGFVAWMQLGFIDESGRRLPQNWAGLGAGLGVGLATGVMRLSDATGRQEYLFGAGLTLFEMSAVVYIEWLAERLRARYHDWSEREEKSEVAKRQFESAQHAYDTWCGTGEQLEGKIREFTSYVESRWLRATKVKDIEQAAIGAVLSGYQRGIAHNQGKLMGINLLRRA